VLVPARHWGTTVQEQQEALPCDALVPDGEVLTRAVTAAAPVDLAFRWLCQLQVAPYSYDTLDNGGRRSPQELTPGADHLRRGDRWMTIFTLADFDAGSHLTLRIRAMRGLFGDVAVTYSVRPAPEGTRLLMRLVWRTPGPGPLGRLSALLLGPGDLVMARRQLLNLKALAERDARR
jgi:hypothetical protein